MKIQITSTMLTTVAAALVAIPLAFIQLADTTVIIQKSRDVEESTMMEAPFSNITSFLQSTTKQCNKSSSASESFVFTKPPENPTQFTEPGGTLSKISHKKPSKRNNSATSSTAKPKTSPSSRDPAITTKELEELSEMLFSRDVNNAWRYIHVNLQSRTTRNSSVDSAPDPLLIVDPEAFRIPTIQRVTQMYDNYQLDTRRTEHTTPAQAAEQTQLIDAFLKTEVMSDTMTFLAAKGFVGNTSSDYETTLRRLWFSLYARGGGHSSSSGFEHVFLTEVKRGRHVSGLHNWIYFNAAEVKKQANYLGYIKHLNLGDKAAVLSFHFNFNSLDKPITAIFVGTSPELEMALYTICFYARPGKKCPVSLGGSKFRIITYKLVYKGRTLPVIASAYPLI